MAVSVTVSVQDQTPAALDGVLVRIFQADGTTFVTEGTTGAPFAAGQVQFSLAGAVAPGTTYIVRLSRSGYYFPGGGQQQTIAVQEPDPGGGANDFGPFSAAQGPTGEVVTVNVTESAVPVDGVLVRVYDALDTFLTEGVTGGGSDPAGAVSFVLPSSASPGTTYIVRFFSQGQVVTNGPAQTIAVVTAPAPPASNVFDVTLTTQTLPQAQDVDMCRVYGVLTDATLRPLPGQVVEFRPCVGWPETDPPVSAHYLGDPTAVRDQVLWAGGKAVSNANGVIDIELPRGAAFEVRMGGHAHPIQVTELVRIPDQASVALEELLFPYVASVAYTSAPFAVAAGQTLDITVVVTTSSGVAVTDRAALAALLEFTPSDAALFSVSLVDDATIRVTGVAAGSGTIQVARVADSFAPRRPAPSAITVTPPTVAVS